MLVLFPNRYNCFQSNLRMAYYGILFLFMCFDAFWCSYHIIYVEILLDLFGSCSVSDDILRYLKVKVCQRYINIYNYIHIYCHRVPAGTARCSSCQRCGCSWKHWKQWGKPAWGWDMLGQYGEIACNKWGEEIIWYNFIQYIIISFNII